MRNDTDDNVSIASSMTAATNYRNSGSRPISGNRLVQNFPPPSINRYQSSSSLSTMNNHSRPISSSSSSLISRPTNLSESQTLSLVLLLSEQDDQYGINMYDALKPTDETEIRAMMRSGYTQHDAVLSLFQRSRGQNTGSISGHGRGSRSSNQNNSHQCIHQ
jgi:hypothetical protein